MALHRRIHRNRSARAGAVLGPEASRLRSVPRVDGTSRIAPSSRPFSTRKVEPVWLGGRTRTSARVCRADQNLRSDMEQKVKGSGLG